MLTEPTTLYHHFHLCTVWHSSCSTIPPSSTDEATPCHPHWPPSFAGHRSCPCHLPCCAQPFQPHTALFMPMPSASPCGPSDHALSRPGSSSPMLCPCLPP